MNRTYIKDMRQLLETAYYYLKDGKSNGCYYLPLEDGLHLVVGYDPEEKLVLAKVAYNCDDLQSDFDMDWYLPSFKDGNCCYVEMALVDKKFRKDAEWFYAECKAMIRDRKKGLVVDWRK